MEQETLVNELRTRVGDPDLSERTLTEVASSALPLFADDSKITDALWNTTTQMLKSAIGQERAARKDWITKQQETLAANDKTAREKWQKEFEENWTKTHPKQAPAESEEPNKTEDEKIAAIVAKAMEANNARLFGNDGKSGVIGEISAYLKQAEAKEKAAKISAIRDELKSYLVSKKASREPVINLAIKDLDIDDNADLDKLKIEVEKSYEAKFNEFYPGNGSPYGGNGAGGNGSGADANLKAYLEAKAKDAAREAEEAENLRKRFK